MQLSKTNQLKLQKKLNNIFKKEHNKGVATKTNTIFCSYSFIIIEETKQVVKKIKNVVDRTKLF